MGGSEARMTRGAMLDRNSAGVCASLQEEPKWQVRKPGMMRRHIDVLALRAIEDRGIKENPY